MTTLAITRDGKITLPKELLDHLGISAGGRIDVVLLPNQRVGFRATKRKGDEGDAAANPHGGERGA